MLEKITHETFESITGETVDLKAEPVSFRADVANVRLLRDHAGTARQPFSVELLAHDTRNHGQGIYRVSHPVLGDLDLFLVPIGPDENGMRYEIVFN